MRIAVAEFSHETCTFCPEPTTIAGLEPYVRRGPAVLDSARGIPGYINGFLQVADAEGAQLVGILRAGMAPGPYTSWMDRECFEKYAGEIAGGIQGAGHLDGVLLALHGAMAVRGIPKPEAELVRRVRDVVGPIPIMVTLDLHANEDHELTDAADAVFVIKTYPHVDTEETGCLAARCMVQTIRGEFVPAQALQKPGIISASIFQASDYHPMKDIYDRCRAWERHPGVYCVSVAPGYAYADVPDVGMSVIAVTNHQPALAQRAAEDVAGLAWSLRAAFARPLPKPREGVAEVLRLVRDGQRPVVIADGADRTGDGTHILWELLAQGAVNFAIPGISDPRVVRQLEQTAVVGQVVTVNIGGWASEHSGTPVEVTGRITFMGRPSYVLVGPMGRGRRVQDGLVVCLDLGNNNHVVVSERMRGSNDSSGFEAVGIDYRSLDIIVLKDRVHHRAFWDGVARVDFPIDAPGIGPADLRSLQYQKIPGDIYPVGKRWTV
ncbi:MAG: M81 family metallopeptidase [Bacillota bacterium]